MKRVWGSGALRRLLQIALGAFVIACSPAVHAATTFVLCFNTTVGATTCNPAGSNFVLIQSDGTLVGSTLTTGGTVSNTGLVSGDVSTVGSKTTITTNSGPDETVGQWDISGTSVTANTAAGAGTAASISFSAINTTGGTGTLNIFWLAYGFPTADLVFGNPIGVVTGTADTGLTVVSTGCGETDGLITDPSSYKACNGTTAIVGGGASSAVVSSFGSVTSPPFNQALPGGSLFTPGQTFALEQKITITAGSTAAAGSITTGLFTLDPAPAPEPATLGLAGVGIALLALKAVRRKRVLTK